MGIGNTTTSSAVASVLLGDEPAEITERGAGLTNEGLERKIHAIEKAIAVNRPKWDDPVDVLAKSRRIRFGGNHRTLFGRCCISNPDCS